MTDVRARTLAEATRLFAAHGFEGTSLQSIAEAVGVRKPSVLYHFSSKEDLRQAVLDDLLARWNEVLPDLLMAAAKADRFDGVLDAMTDFFLEDPDRARLLVRETLDRPEDVRDRLERYVRPWVAVALGQLGTAQTEGAVHPGADLPAYVVHLVQLVVGSIAVMDTLVALLPEDAGDRRERLRTELRRMAKAGLFVSRPKTYEVAAE
jgi:AcrR family transcriptional regulator